MPQFAQPNMTSADKQVAPATPISLLDPTKYYLFGSTHIDSGGCSYYRILFVSQLLTQRYKNVIVSDARLLFNSNFPILASFRLQRACSTNDFEWFRELLKLKKQLGFPVLYEIDDILIPEDVPEYNIYRNIFKEGREAIPFYMDGSDAVTVTCAPLADYYSRKFGIPRGKFRIMPNWLPRYFFDSYQDAAVRERVQSQTGRKKRICFSCGASHYDLNKTGAGDDFSDLLGWIVENRHKYEFIFHGGFPPALEQYADDFVKLPFGPFLNYPLVRRSIRADLYIQPLRHSAFNECKSPIKLLESWAEGTPAFVQDLDCYKQIAPEACFDTPETLDRMVDALFADQDAQIRLIRDNHARMDAFWLDNHLDEWLQLLLYPTASSSDVVRG